MKELIFQNRKKTLYLVTDRKLCGDKNFFEYIEQAVINGVDILQLREKEIEENEFIRIAKEIKKITSKYNIPLIINDNIKVMLNVDAEGIHVGQKDLNPFYIRKKIGRNKLIGLTVESYEQAIASQDLPIDYIGIQVFNSFTKTDSDALGLDIIKLIKSNINTPIAAIGGININNIQEVLDTGVDSIAVISAILKAENIAKATKELKNKIEEL